MTPAHVGPPRIDDDIPSLTIACGNSDRTRPLFDGHVRIEGCDPIYLPLPPEEIFFRAFVHEEFDSSELSLSSYTMRRSKGDCPYVGIPLFISRTFRHWRLLGQEDLRHPPRLLGS